MNTQTKLLLRECCNAFGADYDQLLTPARHRELSDARKAFTVMALKHTSLNITQIARCLRRDHSSICHAKVAAKQLIETDKTFARRINQIEQSIIK